MQRAVRQLYFILFLFLFLLQASSIWSQTSPPQSVLGTEAITKANPTPSLREQSWGILEAGVKDSSSVNRASAVRVLSLLRGEPKAVPMAAKALDDLKPPVRTAAAIALGKLHAASSIPKLKKTLADKNTLVVLAASHSLLTLKDKSGYEAYYAILMGDRKGEGLIASQLATLKDPKQMAALGFHEGIGFVPFGDISYMAFRTMTKDQGAPLRAASAKALEDDPDPLTEDALVQTALSDKNPLVREAALQALAHRGNPATVDKLALALSDDKDPVRFTAAATIVHLSGIAKRHKSGTAAETR
ncbi:MAG TPA: HEAT repeat domain-containing protein [Terriglobales bacterium]|nr:HEAT repeat domain-containing protein [Terriglobales bacterium]